MHREAEERETLRLASQCDGGIANAVSLYQNSTVRMASVHAIQEVLDDPIIKCKQAKNIRWFSHDMAIKAVMRTLPSLLVSLDREASENGVPTAHGLLKFMKCYKFVAGAYLLSDVLPHLSRLSRIFQKQYNHATNRRLIL